MLMMMVMVVLGMWEVRMASAALSAAKCKEERRVGVNTCKQVIYGQNPTSACCKWMRDTHLDCVCPIITPKLAALVDVNRMVKLIKGCGRKLPRHYKCGSTLSFSFSFSFSPLTLIKKYIYCFDTWLISKVK